jgi:hypothetical protein
VRRLKAADYGRATGARVTVGMASFLIVLHIAVSRIYARVGNYRQAGRPVLHLHPFLGFT